MSFCERAKEAPFFDGYQHAQSTQIGKGDPSHVETLVERGSDNPEAILFYPHGLGCNAYAAHKIKICAKHLWKVLINQICARMFRDRI
jgi:hypothetical protein